MAFQHHNRRGVRRHSSLRLAKRAGKKVQMALQRGKGTEGLQLTEELGWETGIEPATVGATVR